MRLVTFAGAAGYRLGVVVDDDKRVIDLSSHDLPTDMCALIESGGDGLRAARQVVDGVVDSIPLADVRLCAPIPRPRRNVFCVGKNYREHAKEFQSSGFDAANANASETPELPIVFTKAPSSVIGPGEAIPSGLDHSNSTDYEGELAVIVGRGGRGISRSGAMDHIYGYSIINDVTARNIQRDHKQWFLGKSIDGFCPMGPYLVTADEVGDIEQSTLTTEVNGEVRQNAKISQLIFDVRSIIETLSRGITLEPGDIIATGTPAGVGIGFDPPRFLAPGDKVAVHIEGIGCLENPVI